MKTLNGMYYFSSKGFANTINGVSTRSMGRIKNSNKINPSNLRELTKTLNIPSENIFHMNQKHTAHIELIHKHSPQELSNTDGLITKEKNKVLITVSADCLPLVFSDPNNKIVGVAHGGYRGILEGIVENMIEKFSQLGSSFSTITIGIGPSIGVCCYIVSKERIEQYKNRFPDFKNFFKKKNNTYFLDLQSVILQILKQYKIPKKNIEFSNICNSCRNDIFFSYRKDSKETYGEFATVIGML